MQTLPLGTPKYTDPIEFQPGLEVGVDPYASAHTGWPDAMRPVWRLSSEQTLLQNEKRNILGLSVGVFWGVIVLLAILLGGGIGGGIGAGLALKSSTCSCDMNDATRVLQTTTVAIAAATSTSSSPNPTVYPKPTTNCETKPAFNGTSITPLDASGNPIPLGRTSQQTFTVMCNTNWPSGAAYGNGLVHDIMRIYTPDLKTCVAACAEYNAGVEVGEGYCRAVSLVLAAGEFCYLRNGTGVNNTSTSGGVRIDSAMLQ